MKLTAAEVEGVLRKGMARQIEVRSLEVRT